METKRDRTPRPQTSRWLSFYGGFKGGQNAIEKKSKGNRSGPKWTRSETEVNSKGDRSEIAGKSMWKRSEIGVISK